MYLQLWILGIFFSTLIQADLARDGLNGSEKSVVHLSSKRFTCAKGLHVVGVRGNSDRPPQPYGALNPGVKGIERRLKGSDNYTIVYDKTSGYASSEQGTSLLLQHTKEYAQACPTTPILLWGYSRGGIIIMDGICGLDTSYQKSVIGVITYGEESRAANQPYNLGTCPQSNSGIFRRTNPEACEPWKHLIRSYCDYGDNLCCDQTPDENLHLKYCQNYNAEVFPWIKAQYKQYRRNQRKQ